MIDIALLRNNPDIVRSTVKNKKADADIGAAIELDAALRELQAKAEEIRRERNEASKARDIEKGKELKTALAEVESEMATKREALEPILLAIPNVPSDDTPVGKDENDNVVLRKVNEPPTFDFEAKDHIALGAELDLIDQETSAAVSGARFSYLKGDLVLLQNAVVQLAFATLTDRGVLEGIIADAGLSVPATPFTPIVPPLMMRPEVMQRMGRLEPREERYHVPSDDLYLIGSAEHTLGPIHMDKTLREDQLPLRYFAYTPAFRREAGSYGKDTRGILRVHQFDKIEMETFVVPELGRDEQDFIVAVQEHLMKSLGLPYQVVQVCTGDMGGPDTRQIDIETWMPGQGKYRETHSSDYVSDYQSRRLNTRVKRNAGGTELVHMNDATAFALGRTLIALMENNQRRDGSIAVPDALIPYMGGRSIIGRAE